MSPLHFPLLSAAFGLCIASVVAQSASSCSTTLTPTNSIKPSVASGYQAALVATGLSKPRSLQFDSSGNLLVVQAGSGIESLQLQDNGGTCISVKSKKTVVSSSGLNHGLALSEDGKTLYASTPEAAYSWTYDPSSSSVGTTNKTIVNGMNTQDHTTRTLLMSDKVEGYMLVSRGSTSNIDPLAASLSSGHSQIKVFNLNNITSQPYNFENDGQRLGWGLRNSVGVVEHPLKGDIYSVENSADEITRDGVNVHEDNPGEEMNYHGTLLQNTFSAQGSNYGYPQCFAAWSPNALPSNSNLTIGSQFAIDSDNKSVTDAYCAAQTPPRLTFQAHMAPLDIKFNNSGGSEAWVTFHGSWDRTNPVGYKLSLLAFNEGSPVAKADSNSSLSDVFSNIDNSKCPDNCFRPVGIAFDTLGRLFISSDSSGEIYVVVRDEADNGTSGGNPPSGSGSAGTSGGKTSGAGVRWGSSALAVGFAAVLAFYVGL